VTRASLNKQPHEVASMFDDVAERYDLTNDVLSLGQDRVWRKAVAKAVDARPAQKVLDLAAGTATSSLPFARTGAYVVPCDFSTGMLRVGKQRHAWLPFTAGDATRLPFKDDTFDAVTISFGLRNVQDTDTALREMHRVTKPGGRVVICEFSHPTWAPFRTVYTEYLMRALPPVARTVSSNPDAYVYLAESIRAWPDQAALAARLTGAGWSKVAWRNLTGGVTAIACDFSQGMLRAGASRPVPKVAGDAMALPLADQSVDGVVISFGLRNVADPDAALREFRRVTRPGGTLVICEFSSPTWTPFRTVYTEYLMQALPRIARAVSSNPEAYVYLAESIRAWPDQAALAGRVQDAGWSDVAWHNLTGGVVALHRARRV
jgi:demethylmenaquinone methyltransferase / 2-methoxy-6-polyprenyl-1,4-benzoquinol methylase